ncbi:MAG: Gfo/Idh/MocA family oxidoreductase [Planctomycetes bacterium]|nr:Gfo/Idh/MocA family oxidoreductase [Planctomycetota bacterium]
MASSRRSFLFGAAASFGAAAVAGTALPQRRRVARIGGEPRRLMVIGVGGRGGDNLGGVAGERIEILCDVDGRRLAAAGKKHPDARQIADFRSVLGDAEACRKLDGVVISTPDHTHFLPAMLALRHGLDVYCEKPLTHTVAQARALAAAAKEFGGVTQMGIQIHANENYRRVVEAVRAGAVGPVRKVIVFVNGTDWSATELPREVPVPEQLDYELWLGPAAKQPFREGFHPAAWRRYRAFGGGTTADMGCHFVDLAFWALELDAPRTLVAEASANDAHCAPAGLHCTYEFGARGDRPALELVWHGGKDRPAAELEARGLEGWTNGVLFLGDDGWLISDYTRHVIGPVARAESFEPPPHSIPPSPGHYQEWLQCCRERSQPSCSFAYGGPLTETVLLADVAARARPGKKLSWDAAQLRFDDDAANALLTETARDGFGA